MNRVKRKKTQTGTISNLFCFKILFVFQFCRRSLKCFPDNSRATGPVNLIAKLFPLITNRKQYTFMAFINLPFIPRLHHSLTQQ